MPDVTKPTPRQRLIDAAADLFYRQGIGAVGVDLVSKAAGVSKRTLYAEFGSKDQLIAQALDANGEGILARYLPGEEARGGRRRSAGEEIVAVFGRLSGWAATEAFRGCPFINTAVELADAGHPARGVALDYTGRIRSYFARQAERGGAGDPQQLAGQLLAFFDGAIVLASMGTPLPDATIAGGVRALLDAAGVR